MAKNSNKIGKIFEIRLSDKFNEYRKDKLAFISKVPTDWVVIRGAKGKIATAYPRGKSEFLDYCGCLKNGEIIFIEAKSCNNSTSFPLSNIKPYQFELIEEYLNYTDKVYMVVEMRQTNEIFLFNAKLLLNFEEVYNRKSIPLKWLQDNCIKVNDLDILKYIKE